MRVLSLPPPCVRGSLPETERGGRRAPPRSKLSAGVDGPRRAVQVAVAVVGALLDPSRRIAHRHQAAGESELEALLLGWSALPVSAAPFQHITGHFLQVCEL
jgi:hypothetical protein